MSSKGWGQYHCDGPHHAGQCERFVHPQQHWGDQLPGAEDAMTFAFFLAENFLTKRNRPLGLVGVDLGVRWFYSTCFGGETIFHPSFRDVFVFFVLTHK